MKSNTIHVTEPFTYANGPDEIICKVCGRPADDHTEQDAAECDEALRTLDEDEVDYVRS